MSIPRRYRLRLVLILLALASALAVFTAAICPAAARPAAAARLQALAADGIMAEVNALRASQGLAPYTVDGGLARYSQAHSEYQAAIDAVTHVHKDSPQPQELGLLENIASGSVDYLDAGTVVYQIWSDALHRQAMTGYASGSMGAGVAANGSTVYITLNVRPGEGLAPVSQAQPTSAPGAVAQAASPSAPEASPQPLLTSTPRADGSVRHTVGFGESLWSIAIAYGVRIVDIRTLNGLPPDSTEIYQGQVLIIWPPGSFPNAPTAQVESGTGTPGSSLAAPGSLAATRLATRMPPRPTATLRPTRTPRPAAPPTEDPAPERQPALQLNNRTVGLALLGISAVGLLLVLFFGFIKK